MIGTNETETETVERHVREAEEHVARQREIVNRLPPSGEVAEMARSLLVQYEEALSLQRTHLARLRGNG
jgi:hypothetical protein